MTSSRTRWASRNELSAIAATKLHWKSHSGPEPIIIIKPHSVDDCWHMYNTYCLCRQRYKWCLIIYHTSSRYFIYVYIIVVLCTLHTLWITWCHQLKRYNVISYRARRQNWMTWIQMNGCETNLIFFIQELTRSLYITGFVDGQVKRFIAIFTFYKL